jgi:hypothetical protein
MSLLPPYYPPPGVPPAEPKYDDIGDIIIELWDYCMDLEDEYHKTGQHDVLIRFATTIVIVQYLEDMLLAMEGYNVFDIYF